MFRVLLQFAESVKDYNFEIVELAFRGNTKFKLGGVYFKQLGEEYSWQNPIYTARTFPENLINPDGSQAYGQWTGGWLGVLNEQMSDFNDFHDKWYLDDLIKEKLNGG